MAVRKKGWLLTVAGVTFMASLAISHTATAAFVVVPTGDPVGSGNGNGTSFSQDSTPGGLESFVETLFDGETATFLGKLDVDDNTQEGAGQGAITISNTTTKNDGSGEIVSGDWLYTPDAGNTLLPNVIIVAGGTGQGAYRATAAHFAGLTEGSFDITDFGNPLGGAALSNISGVFVTPLPAAAWMMIGGLGLVAGAARKFRRPGAQAA